MPEVTAAGKGGRVSRQLPRVRRAETTRFSVNGQKGYLTTATAHGTVSEVTIRMAKQGSTLAGMTDALGSAISSGLQAGAPLEVYVSTFTNTRFAPAGQTDDPELPLASSVMDYVARRIAVDALPPARRRELGIVTAAERAGREPGTDDGAGSGWSGADLPGLAMPAPGGQVGSGT